jgi:predicted XRE-type DNA-binding protein
MVFKFKLTKILKMREDAVQELIGEIKLIEKDIEKTKLDIKVKYVEIKSTQDELMETNYQYAEGHLRILKKLEKAEGSLALSENPTPLEQFRYDIQQKFVRYILKTKISQREMAEMLAIDEGKVSKILRNRLDDFSTDRLIGLYEKINPKIKLKVS